MFDLNRFEPKIEPNRSKSKFAHPIYSRASSGVGTTLQAEPSRTRYANVINQLGNDAITLTGPSMIATCKINDASIAREI